MMITKEVGIALGAVAVLLVGGAVAYAASSSSAAPPQSMPTDVKFIAGTRYKIYVAFTNGAPTSTVTGNGAAALAFVSGQGATLSPNPFKFVDAAYDTDVSPASPNVAYPTVSYTVDALVTATVSSTTLAYLAGASAPTNSFLVYVATVSGGGVSRSSYDASIAIPCPLQTSITVAVGTSLKLTNADGALWNNTSTSDATIVAPSIPATTNGFVALAVGTATLSGSYTDSANTLRAGTVVVTVVAAGSGAISGTGSTASSGAPPPATTVVTGAPTRTGWTTDVQLGQSSVTVSAWNGDEIVVALPSGATWAPSGSSTGWPTSGSAVQTTLASGLASGTPFVMPLAWVYGGKTYTTTLTFVLGRTFALADHWDTYDSVRMSFSQADGVNASAVIGQPAYAAELAAVNAAYATLFGPNPNPTPAQAFEVILTVGPWGAIFDVDVSTLRVYGPGDTLPPDWPSSDTTGLIRAEFRYKGPTIAVTALPFPMTSWVRVT